MVCAIYVFCSAWLFLLNISPRKAVSSPAVMCFRDRKGLFTCWMRKGRTKDFISGTFRFPSCLPRQGQWFGGHLSPLPPPPDEKYRPGGREELGKASTFSLWRIREAYSERGLTDLMWQRELSLRMKDWAQLKGYAAIFAQAFFFFVFHFPGPRSIATDLKPRGHVLLNKSDVSPRDQTCLPSGTGETF